MVPIICYQVVPLGMLCERPLLSYVIPNVLPIITQPMAPLTNIV